jgi:hypothetical protein
VGFFCLKKMSKEEIISINKARKILGKFGDKLSDEQITELLESLVILADLAIASGIKNMSSNNKLGSID